MRDDEASGSLGGPQLATRLGQQPGVRGRAGTVQVNPPALDAFRCESPFQGLDIAFDAPAAAA